MNHQNAVKMIKYEIEINYNIFRETIGYAIENSKEQSNIGFYYISDQNYFTIYENSTKYLLDYSNEEDEKLVKNIINFYACSKHILDQFKINSKIIDLIDKIEIESIINKVALTKDNTLPLYNALSNSKIKLQDSYKKLNQAYENLK